MLAMIIGQRITEQAEIAENKRALAGKHAGKRGGDEHRQQGSKPSWREPLKHFIRSRRTGFHTRVGVHSPRSFAKMPANPRRFPLILLWWIPMAYRRLAVGRPSVSVSLLRAGSPWAADYK